MHVHKNIYRQHTDDRPLVLFVVPISRMLRDNVGESYDIDLSILKVLPTFSHSIIDILARNVFTHPWFGD